MRISDWSSDVCSSDLLADRVAAAVAAVQRQAHAMERQVVERADVRPREVADMNEIAHAGAVWGVVVVAVDLDARPVPVARPAGHLRSEERWVRKGCVSSCSNRWSPSY